MTYLQAKRTNIGIALITNPRVLFLDEPTSGLDSYTAHEVICLVVSRSCRIGTISMADLHWLAHPLPQCGQPRGALVPWCFLTGSGATSCRWC